MGKKDDERASEQARAQYESIAEMVETYNNAKTDNEREGAEQVIEVRTDWYIPGSDNGNKATEYNILLCTGGPAVRIIGDLNEYLEPETAKLEYQDWFTPWNEYRLNEEETAILLEYAQKFYFGG